MYTRLHRNQVFYTCIASIVWVLASSTAVSATSFEYSCSDCVSPDCICASTAPPGGLDPTNTPQIVLLTFDDPVYQKAYKVHQSILTNHWNPNGTPIQATFFVLTLNSDYRLIQRHYGSGHEIAIHTMTHTTGTNTDVATWRREIFGARKALADYARIPIEEIRGFRAPDLKYCHNSFQALAEAGMEYDSSLDEHVAGLSTSQYWQIWPYTLDNGLGQETLDGTPPKHPFPGLFEVPMWATLDTNGHHLGNMDAPASYTNYTQVLNLWKSNFSNHYEGNRAPFGFSFHEAWITEEDWRVDAVNDFITWALDQTNTWFVSNYALLEYMRNPVDVSGAAAFPPFITTPREIDPESAVRRCTYKDPGTNGSFRTCAECPRAYPSPDSIFSDTVTVTGGVALIEITEWYANSYGGHFVISNNTADTIFDWRGHFTITNGNVTTFWGGGTGEVDGNDVSLLPDDTETHLAPGETAYIGFWVENSGGIYGLEDVTPTCFGLTPKQPTIDAVTFDYHGNVTASWDNSAPGYYVLFSTNLVHASWQTIAEVHGRAQCTTSLPPESVSGYLKLRALP